MTPHVVLHLSSPLNLNGEAAGRTILEAFEQAPSLVPDRYGNYEPLRKHYANDDLDRVLRDWTWPFLWKRSRPRSSGGIWMADRNHPKHSSIILRVKDYQRVPEHELLTLMVAWATGCSADVALLHLFTDLELDRAKASGALSSLDRAGKEYSFNLPSHELQSNLPDFYWAMIFGRPFIEMFGRDRLLSTPAQVVRELGAGHILIQLTDNLRDSETDYTRFATVRERVIKHLGADAFFSPERTVYRVPKFSFYEPGGA